MSKTIPHRKDVNPKDKWDLSSIYKSVEEWEKALSELSVMTEGVVAFKGKLGESSGSLLNALKAYEEALLQMETVYHYASLEHEADEDDTAATDRYGRATMAYTDMQASLSFIDPELMAIDEELLHQWAALPEFANYKVYLEKLLHFKKYTLSEKEERILSLQGQPAMTADTAFSVLTNVDMHFLALFHTSIR